MRLTGQVDMISRARILGWVADLDNPTNPVIVSVWFANRLIAQVVADRFRNGLREPVGQGLTGFHQFDVTFTPQLSVFEAGELIVMAGDGVVLPQGRAQLHTPELPPSPLKPILITSTGRSGTTMLMREFAGRQDIVVANYQPFEIKMCSYYGSALRALLSAADRINSTNPDEMFGGANLHRIGHNPFHQGQPQFLVKDRKKLDRFFEIDVPNAQFQTFRVLIERFYRILQTEYGKIDAPYFSEKGDTDEVARQATRTLMGGCKEIVLLRDARDLYCSAIQFWKLNPHEALRMLADATQRLCEIRKTAGADTLFVRYESLLTEPLASRRRLYGFLGLPFDESALSGGGAGFEGHGTSANPQQSLARWERELSKETIDLCNTAFATYNEMFGYAMPPGSSTSHQNISVRIDTRMLALPVVSSRVIPTAAGVEHIAADLSFATSGNATAMLGAGWGRPEQDGTWSNAPHATLRLPTWASLADKIQIFLEPFIERPSITSQTVEVRVGEQPPAVFQVCHPFQVEIKIQAGGPRDVQIELALANSIPMTSSPANMHERGARGVKIRSIRVITADQKRADHIRTLRRPTSLGADAKAIFARFESLGENCEFGFAQRQAGSDELGLLRYSSSPFERLIKALDEDFARVGTRETLELVVSESSEYMAHDKAYGFLSHTWAMAGRQPKSDVLEAQLIEFQKLLADFRSKLRNCDKVFVYHSMRPLNISEARILLGKLSAFKPAKLLWVELCDPSHSPGVIIDHGGGLVQGFIDRFARAEAGFDPSYDCWLELCRKSLELFDKVEENAV